MTALLPSPGLTMRAALFCALFVLAAPLSIAQISLPITFEEMVDYELVDFGGNASQLIADPEDATNTVVESVRTAAAECFAGTTVANATGFDAPIPFAESATTMSVRVWSPAADTPVRLKVEQFDNPTVSVETEVMTTMAMTWETLVFDFANEVPGTAPINFASAYTKASIFFNFQCPDTTPVPEATYYWDDVAFGGTPTGGEGAALPQEVRLTQNYPNPFHAQTTISFSLPTPDHVAIYVYNVLGQQVATLVDDMLDAGSHAVSFDAAGLASGTYFYRLHHGPVNVTRTMILAR